jgi:hypothetical protein
MAASHLNSSLEHLDGGAALTLRQRLDTSMALSHLDSSLDISITASHVDSSLNTLTAASTHLQQP